MKKLIYIACFFSLIVNAQNIRLNDRLRQTQLSSIIQYPTAVDVNTITWPDYTAPTAEPESYLVPFIDTISGAKVTRIGDQTAFGVTGQQVGHNYSNNSVWNANGTLIKLNTQPARILYDSDYSVAYTRNLPSWSNWSNVNPQVIYGIASGNQFVSYNVVTDATTVLHTFSDYESMSIGQGEGRPDNNDTYVVLHATLTATGDDYLINYNIQTDTILGTYLIPDGNLDWATVSPLGNYIVLSWVTNGSGENQGFKKANLDFTGITHLYDQTEHADIGIDVNGDEVIVTIGGTIAEATNHYIVMIRLSDGTVENLFNTTGTPKGIYGGHVSCRNIDRPGWAYISESCCPSNDVVAAELFSVKLTYDDSNLIERYGKHHSDHTVNADTHSARATVNRNGTKICFDSNYGDATLKSWNHAPAWVLDTNGATLTQVDYLQNQEKQEQWCNITNMLGQKMFEGTFKDFVPEPHQVYAITFNDKSTVKQIRTNQY